MSVSPAITQLLAHANQGDRQSQERVLELVYSELHRLASGYLRRERAGHTLQASALVNEAYLRLLGGGGAVQWESRAHFFVTAAQTMRRILIDHARKRAASKREGLLNRVELHDHLAVTGAEDPAAMIDLDEALERLAQLDPRQSRIVELRFLAGLSVEETAEVLNISPKTVKRDWSVARAWLEGELTREPQ
jgi:RNA polymerase sigma factor (TIGR02999 family)